MIKYLYICDQCKKEKWRRNIMSRENFVLGFISLFVLIIIVVLVAWRVDYNNEVKISNNEARISALEESDAGFAEGFNFNAEEIQRQINELYELRERDLRVFDDLEIKINE